MPIYEFICQKCGHQFEALVPLGGEKGVSCPECRNSGVQKLFSSFGIGGGGSRLKTASSSCTSCSSKSCSTCH
ncbi:MAG: zinc ribbon domain-containing protein [Candidatus Aminicenantales bacterium]